MTHAAIIATKNGEATIRETLASLRPETKVYVVSDGSTDATAQVARDAGATVLELAENVGKPAALFKGLRYFNMFRRFDFIGIFDDDTTVEPGFMDTCLKRFESDEKNGIVCGKTLSSWPHEHRWNPLVGSRMFSYWKYQITVKRGQSAMGAINCVAGSNSVYRSSLLKEIIRETTPYIVDDCYWTHETHRRNLGKIVYEHDATAYVQDPTTLGAWWKQNTRWLWGTFQAIWGHKVGRRRTWFDFWYVTLLVDWVLYLGGQPLLIALALTMGFGSPLLFGLWYCGGYLCWTAAAAIATRRWRLVPLTPAIMVLDWLYRLVFVWAIIKTIRQPTVDVCKWDSPARYNRKESV